MSGTHYDDDDDDNDDGDGGSDAFCVSDCAGLCGSYYRGPRLPAGFTCPGFRIDRVTKYIAQCYVLAGAHPRQSAGRGCKLRRLSRHESIRRGILISPGRALKCSDKSLCNLANGNILMFDVCNAPKAQCVGDVMILRVSESDRGSVYPICAISPKCLIGLSEIDVDTRRIREL